MERFGGRLLFFYYGQSIMLMSTHSSGGDTHIAVAAAAHTQQQHPDRCSVAALFRSSHSFEQCSAATLRPVLSSGTVASPGGRNSSTRPQPQSQPNRRLFVTEEEEKKDNRKGSCFLCDKQGHWMKDCPTKSPKTPSSSQSPSPSSPSPIGGHGVPNLICRCGTGTCFVRRSKTTRNPDRLFYCCPLTDKSCNFFEWCDEVWNDKITVPVCRCFAGPCSIYKEPTFTRSNAGRYFFVCPIKKGQGACDFIQSLDATSSHSDKSVISQSTLTNCHDTSPSSNDLVEDGDFSQQGMDVVSHVVNSSEHPQKLGAISEISKRDKVKLMDFQAQEETPDEPMRKHCKRQRHEAPEIDGFILDSTSYCSDMPQSKSGDPTTTKALRASTITSEGWYGRLVFSPSRCLIFPAPKPFFCCVVPAFHPIFVPQDVDTFDVEAANIAMPNALFVDSQPFKEQVEEFIGCASSLAEIGLSIHNDRSAQELVIMYERKNYSWKIFLKMKIGNRLDQITEDMLNSEASLQVAFGEAEAAMKLCQQREAERNVAKEAFEKARSNLRRSL
ncbi:hypothetical protein TEA_009462 [Camellia sinensis var. sinensis]|uniref:Uncharacterized protein n=1 Tax=Camellia sinensis var. sinensis TaxID=542762 RepID=A0A4S4EG17_CAMSN|nr:hypothetical protein TEA_009462 [Camellia sinensis var. sinensis]